MQFGALRGSAMASPGGKLSRVARLMRNGETDRFRMLFVKKVQLEKRYVLIYLHPVSKKVAVPHPPLRGTFPPGEGIGLPNFRLQFLVEEFRKTAGENSLYDDGLFGIRWRFPHQFENWFGMTVLFEALAPP